MDYQLTVKEYEDNPPGLFRYEILAGDEVVGTAWMSRVGEPIFRGVNMKEDWKNKLGFGEVLEAFYAFLRAEGLSGVYYETDGSCPFPGFKFIRDRSSGWDDHICMYYLSFDGEYTPSPYDD